jgi:hypothetical protein
MRDPCDRSHRAGVFRNSLKQLRSGLARKLYQVPNMTNRLSTIATAQKKTRLRDVIFAGFLVMGAALAVTSVSTAAATANTQLVQR